MDKVKEVLKDNIPIIVVALVVITIAIVYKVVENHKENEINNRVIDLEPVKYIPTSYEENEYRVIDVENQDIAILYYKAILNKMLNDRKSLWEILTKEEKKKYKNYEAFEKEINRRITVNSRNNTLKEYSVDEAVSSRTFILLDSESYQYRIYENGVWNFQVEFIGYK